MNRFESCHCMLFCLLFLAGCFIIGCDNMMMSPINIVADVIVADVIEDVPEPTTVDEPAEPVYTYIGFRPDEDMIAPINPVVEWENSRGIVWQKTREGSHYRRRLWRDEWEISSRERAGPLHNNFGPFDDDFEHWFYAEHASKMVYDLSGGDYLKFDGHVAIRFDKSIVYCVGTVEFIFLIDDVEAFRSEKVEGLAALGTVYVEFDIPVDAQNLTIMVTDAGDGEPCDHWIIGEARLTHR